LLRSSPRTRLSDRSNIVSEPSLRRTSAPYPRLVAHPLHARSSSHVVRQAPLIVPIRRAITRTNRAWRSELQPQWCTVPEPQPPLSPATHTTVYTIPAHCECMTKPLPSSLHCRPLYEVFQRRSKEFGKLPLLVSLQFTCDHCGIVLSPRLPRQSLLHCQYLSLAYTTLLPMTEDSQVIFSPKRDDLALVCIMARACEGQGKGTTRIAMAMRGCTHMWRMATHMRVLHTQIS